MNTNYTLLFVLLVLVLASIATTVLLFVIRVVEAIFSKKVRAHVMAHPVLHILWFIVFLGGIFILGDWRCQQGESNQNHSWRYNSATSNNSAWLHAFMPQITRENFRTNSRMFLTSSPISVCTSLETLKQTNCTIGIIAPGIRILIQPIRSSHFHHPLLTTIANSVSLFFWMTPCPSWTNPNS